MSRASLYSCVLAAAVIVLASAGACGAQTTGAQRAGAASRQGTDARRAAAAAQGEADEDFDLNIVERRITETDFFASTSVGGDDGRGLALRVGVAVGAERIDVLLRNVRGHVRFRASLGALQRVLDSRRINATTEGPPAVP